MHVGTVIPVFSCPQLADTKGDELKEKLCLIDDVFKTWRLLEAFDECRRHISHAGELFNNLFELPIPELEAELKHYSGILSAKYSALK